MENLEFEDYWSDSTKKAFSFDEDIDAVDNSIAASKWDALNEECNQEQTANFTVTSVVSPEVLKIVLQEQCLTDDCAIPKGITPEKELKLLRRQIQATLYSPMPEITAHKLLLGKTCPLEIFKSLEEKEKLLDVVYENGGGDSVISVLLFLKRTLCKEKFFEILRRRPNSTEQYLSFLRSRQNSKEEALKLLKFFGRYQEALALELASTLDSNSIESKKEKLKDLVQTYSEKALNVNGCYIETVHSAMKLLELIEKERNSLDNMVDLHSTPIEVLYACCRKHNNWSEPNMTCSISPFRLAAEQRISAAQFEWTALNERTISQAYADLENIFERIPTWHPIKQKQFHINISIETAILRLHSLKAPQSVLYLFLSKMPNNIEKVEVARRVTSIKAEIDAFAGLKDLTEIVKLKEKLTERSEEKFYCEKIIKQLQNKRWSTDNIKKKF